MPSKRTHKKLSKPWHARAKRDDLEYSLGYYATWEEAHNAELEFAEWYEDQYDHNVTTRKRIKPKV